jgi:predicted ATP-grasp superfamily ATP-dependent carboligase
VRRSAGPVCYHFKHSTGPFLTRMIKVLVLDGCQRSALAATRSLGRRGLTVFTADTRRVTLAGASRHSSQSFEYPDPRTRAGEFVDWVVSMREQLGLAAVLPLTDLTTMLLVPAAARLGPARLLAGPAEAYRLVSDKGRLVQLARDAGVRVPETVEIRSLAEFESCLHRCRFPLVLKPAQSKILEGNRVHETGVHVARDADDARAYLAAQPWLGLAACLLQEFIPGHGAGIFAFYAGGAPVAWFCHRRLREKPPGGGVSVLSESVPIDDRLREIAARILGIAGWNGAAMVEFRVDDNGAPWLMEINGRLWGSLQLAIDSGVDFPWLAWRAANGELLKPESGYVVGRRLRWLLGDFDNLLIQLRQENGAAPRLRAVAQFFLSFLDLRARQEIFRWGDMKPAARELASWLRALT